MIHFWGGKLTYYGDYASFVATKEERHKLQQRQYEAQLMKRQHMQVCAARPCIAVDHTHSRSLTRTGVHRQVQVQCQASQLGTISHQGTG